MYLLLLEKSSYDLLYSHLKSFRRALEGRDEMLNLFRHGGAGRFDDSSSDSSDDTDRGHPGTRYVSRRDRSRSPDPSGRSRKRSARDEEPRRDPKSGRKRHRQSEDLNQRMRGHPKNQRYATDQRLDANMMRTQVLPFRPTSSTTIKDPNVKSMEEIKELAKKMFPSTRIREDQQYPASTSAMPNERYSSRPDDTWAGGMFPPEMYKAQEIERNRIAEEKRLNQLSRDMEATTSRGSLGHRSRSISPREREDTDDEDDDLYASRKGKVI